MRGQSVERLRHGLIRQFQSFAHGFPFNHFRRHGAGSDCAAAPERIELDVLDDSVFYFEINFHDVSADGIADLTHAVRIFYHPYVSGISEMIHYLFAV